MKSGERDSRGVNRWTFSEIFHRQRAGDPIVDGLEAREAEWVRKALADNPEERPTLTADQWVTELKAILHKRVSLGQDVETDAGKVREAEPQGELPVAQVIAAFEGHTGGVNSCSFSPDGQRIVTGSDDNTAIVWDAQSGQPLLTLNGHTEWIRCCAFSPDGRRIVAGSWDGTAIVWDAECGQPLLTLEGHTDWVWSCSNSPDGRRIVTASGFKLTIWDADDGSPVAWLWPGRDGNWLVATPLGYFDGSDDFRKLIRLKDSSGRILESPEQIRRYHRPDLVRNILESGIHVT
ncbi:MAG: hypothetical protein KatS3mg110_1058 [Pirellulaceae bacterium]|nr:MAG: hypothetical protein KatS3mg110_1058 [Pirellulaceae bacterium]